MSHLVFFVFHSVMEQAHARERHGDTVFVAHADDMVVPDRAARFRDIGHAALARALNVIPEGEKRVAAERNARDRGKICLLFLFCEQRGLRGKILLPHAVGKHIVTFVGDIDIDHIVPIRTPQRRQERQVQHLFMLAQMPDIRLVAGKPRAVDAGLLPRTDADRLPVLRIADGVGLRIFQRDQRNDQVALCTVGFVSSASSILKLFLPCWKVTP